jgi:DNA (cytosine-5)-methyltransferase 1
MNVLDLFAGPGGWDEGIRALGIDALGIELNESACATRDAAGHRTLRGDVSALNPVRFEADLLIGSPPCQAFSVAGDGKGREDVELISQCARSLTIGIDVRETMRAKLSEPHSLLAVEPLRWALELRPRWIALEQVPPVLGLWKFYGRVLEDRGYKTWAGLLNAADYGVPQTRERAFLLASLDGPVHPPLATHCRGGAFTFEGELLPWVTMAQALGWGATERPYATLAGGTAGGPCYDFTGGSGARKGLLAEREQGRWITQIRRSGDRIEEGFDPDAEPSQTVTTRFDRWQTWPLTEPATTVAGDPRISARCHDEGSQGRDAKTTEQVRAGEYEGTEPIRLTIAEASILQSFPPDYPWQGTKTSKHTQIGNAVPPMLARSVIAALTGAQHKAVAA